MNTPMINLQTIIDGLEMVDDHDAGKYMGI